MEAAYALKPLPDLQYNLAQCYERLGRYTDAADAYETVPEGQHRAPDRKLVETRIANLRERAAATAAGSQAAPLPSTGEGGVQDHRRLQEAPPPPGRGVRIAAYGLGVLALGALASGIAFAVLAKQNADVVTKGGSTTTSADVRRAGARRAEERAGRRHRLGRQLRRGGAVRRRRGRAVPARQQDRQGGAQADDGAVAVADGRRLRRRGSLLMRALRGVLAVGGVGGGGLLQPVAAGGRLSLLGGGQLVSVGAALHLRLVRRDRRPGGLQVHADGDAAGRAAPSVSTSSSRSRCAPSIRTARRRPASTAR